MLRLILPSMLTRYICWKSNWSTMPLSIGVKLLRSSSNCLESRPSLLVASSMRLRTMRERTTSEVRDRIVTKRS